MTNWEPVAWELISSLGREYTHMFILGTAIQAGSIAFPGQIPPNYKNPSPYGVMGSPIAYLSIILLSLPLRFTMGAKLF